MKHLMFTIRFGVSLSAALVAVALTGCEIHGRNYDQHVSGIGDKLRIPEKADTSASIPDPNHTGPKQIYAKVDLNGTDKTICIGPASKVYVISPPDSKKSYLVIEGVPCEK